MTTRDIRSHNVHSVCDVCGRSLLRGERAEVFTHGADRRSVCELCKTRALHEGWVREGTMPEFRPAKAAARRRRSLLGRFRKALESGNGKAAELASVGRHEPGPTSRELLAAPRHVAAISRSDDQKVATAIDVFNRSEHRRTVAGVARSLGAPAVCIAPDPVEQNLVWIVVAWELCWYRYAIDLEDGGASLDAHGYELDQLSGDERLANAIADESGQLRIQ